MKNRKRETCTSGTVRDEDGNILIYSEARRRGGVAAGGVTVSRQKLIAELAARYRLPSTAAPPPKHLPEEVPPDLLS
jgi:hypothetical protein